MGLIDWMNKSPDITDWRGRVGEGGGLLKRENDTSCSWLGLTVSFLVVFARWLVCDIDGHKQCDTADVTDVVATADIRRSLPVLCVVTDG